MKRFALIGHPVAGSLSPALFSAAYGGIYPYDLIDAPFPQAWERFKSLYHGINITAPHKQEAFAAVDRLSPGAKECGAVNLAVKADGLIWGYNTDMDGVSGAVRECSLEVTRALILGAGGAARAAAAAAKKMGCDVVIANRTPGKASELAAAMGCKAVPMEDITSLSPDLVIYTLPGDAPLPENLGGKILSGAVVLEAEYKHPAISGALCRHYISGKRWLLWQAVAGYQLFTGEAPDIDAMEKVL